MTDRTLIILRGADRIRFLQGLVTNDVPTTSGAIAYAALLSPQGKYIADFFMLGQDDQILIDVATSHAPTLAQRLSMYRLRADVQIDHSRANVARGTDEMPDGALADPRHPSMGWRHYGGQTRTTTDWDAIRVAHIIPETGIELTPDTYILEAGFERLNGINFKKGCYVGQEIAARMKHKTTLSKGLRRVAISGSAQPGDKITSDDKPTGIVHTVAGDHAIAYLRFNRTSNMQTPNARLTIADDGI